MSKNGVAAAAAAVVSRGMFAVTMSSVSPPNGTKARIK
jgi:hypothetical protein